MATGFHTLCADFRADVRSKAASGKLTTRQKDAAIGFVEAMENAVDNADKSGVKEARAAFNQAIPDNHPVYRQGYKIWDAYAVEYPKALQRMQSGARHEEASSRPSSKAAQSSGGGFRLRNPFASRNQRASKSAGDSKSTPVKYLGVDERRAVVTDKVGKLVTSFHASLTNFEAMWRQDCRDHASNDFNESLVILIEDMRAQSNDCRSWINPKEGYMTNIEGYFHSPRTLSRPGRNAREIRDLRNMWSEFKDSYYKLRKELDDVTWLSMKSS